VRWDGGTRRPQHGHPASKRRDFTWWTRLGLARDHYIDHAAQHVPSPA